MCIFNEAERCLILSPSVPDYVFLSVQLCRSLGRHPSQRFMSEGKGEEGMMSLNNRLPATGSLCCGRTGLQNDQINQFILRCIASPY